MVFADEILEHLLGDVRFEDPHGAVFAVNRRGALSFVAVLLFFLPAPGLRAVVVLPDAVVELAGEAADHGFIAGVGKAKAAAGEAAQVFVGADDDGGFAHAFGLHGGDDPRAGAAVDDQIGRGGGGRQVGGQTQPGCNQEANSFHRRRRD